MTWGPFLEVPVTFRTRKVVSSSCVCIQDQIKSFNDFENDTIKLSLVNKAELTGL